MPIMVKTCNCCNLMRAVDQKPDNQLEWPNYAHRTNGVCIDNIVPRQYTYIWA